MEPDRFEKHIKNQFEEREIRPSSKAWEKLAEELNTVQPKTEKRNYLRYAIAASFIGFLVLTIFFVNRTEKLNAPIQVVETPSKNVDEKFKEPKISVEIGNDRVVEIEDLKVEKVLENKVADKSMQPDETIITVTELANKTDEIEFPFNESDAIINSKIQEVITQVDFLEAQNISVTDAEVDSLLRRAQQEIMNEKLFRDNRSVDAMVLLTEVEDELDKSFRDQIFESLKSGFVKIRTAVADRNN